MRFLFSFLTCILRGRDVVRPVSLLGNRGLRSVFNEVLTSRLRPVSLFVGLHPGWTSAVESPECGPEPGSSAGAMDWLTAHPTGTTFPRTHEPDSGSRVLFRVRGPSSPSQTGGSQVYRRSVWTQDLVDQVDTGPQYSSQDTYVVVLERGPSASG